MKSLLTAAVAVLSVMGSIVAEAAQIKISESVRQPGGNLGASYIGQGGNNLLGTVENGGYHAFGRFGRYFQVHSDLAMHRRTEAFQALNLFRFYDTFTNVSQNTLNLDMFFMGSLTNSSHDVLLEETGLDVVCYSGGTGSCHMTPVIAFLAGNNGRTNGYYSQGAYYAHTKVSLKPGETIGLLNYAFLARDTSGVLPSDITLAIDRGRELLRNPYLDGLSEAERARVINWNFSATSPVPEPAVVGVLGVGLAGIAAMRRRRKA